mgnify:CR=1 FL=1
MAIDNALWQKKTNAPTVSKLETDLCVNKYNKYIKYM